MKKKTYAIIILTLTIVEVFSVSNSVQGFDYNLFILNTNKPEYYNDELIKINASWELNYDVVNEIAYVQIQIKDKYEQLIWNSSKNYQIGNYEKNWTVDIKDFNLEIINSSYILYVKFFVFFCYKDTGSDLYYYPETIEIRVIKRNISCDLIGYRDEIKMGENLNLVARFYDANSENIQYLINQDIQLMIINNDIIIQQTNYTTNISGEINLNLISPADLKIGQNFLILSITNNNLYNDSRFDYEIYVDKNEPSIEIIKFKNYLEHGEDLDIILRCFYSLNQSEIILANYNLLIRIYDNKSLIFINEYITDKFGFLEVSISQDSFNYTQKNQIYMIKIFLNETDFLYNKTLILNLNLNQNNYLKILNSFQIKIFSFTSVLIIMLIILSYVFINKKGKNEKILTELIIRY
ncbi:MAG: hypothetical protein ACFFAA_06655 [Promethearchaeota archaeon]